MVQHWVVETAERESARTPEVQRQFDRLEDQMIGRLEFSDGRPTELDELEEEIGIPRPSWFTAMTPTMSDVARTGLALRRS